MLLIAAWAAAIALLAPEARAEEALTYTSRVVGQGVPSPLSPFTEAEFSNGLRAIVRQTRGVPVATVDVWVATGSANEEERVGGISHFFEHMFFKGSGRYGLGEMDLAIKRLGGRNNASTGVETTHYFATVPSESVATAVDVIAEGVQHPLFDPAEIERERNVIKEEIRRKEDTPSSKVWPLFQRALAPGLPYARPVLGTFESLDRIDHDAFAAYLARHYVPRNMVVVVTGDVDTKGVLDLIAARFAGAKDVPPPAPAEFDLPALEGPRIVAEQKDTRQTYFMIGYPTPGRRAREDRAALEVSAAILARGKSSRLERSLVEKQGLLSSVDAVNYSFRNGGALLVSGEGAPEKSEAARRAVISEMERLASSLPSDEEVARAKSLILNQWTLDNESTSSMSATLGILELFYGADEAIAYPQRIASVAPLDVQRVMRRYVTPGRTVMSLITPEGEGGTPEPGVAPSPAPKPGVAPSPAPEPGGAPSPAPKGEGQP